MAALSVRCWRQRPRWEPQANFLQRLPLGNMCWQRPSFGACGRDESFLKITTGISMAELEFAIVEFMISSLRGVHPRVHPGYTPKGTPPMKDGSLSRQGSCAKSIL